MKGQNKQRLLSSRSKPAPDAENWNNQQHTPDQGPTADDDRLQDAQQSSAGDDNSDSGRQDADKSPHIVQIDSGTVSAPQGTGEKHKPGKNQPTNEDISRLDSEGGGQVQDADEEPNR